MNRVKRLLDILLLLVNSVGIAGAVLEVLGIHWSVMWRDAPLGDAAPGAYGYAAGKTAMEGTGVILNGGIFWGGLFLCCVAAVLIYRGHSRKRRLMRLGICALLYVLSAFIFRRQLCYGLHLALKDAVEQLNHTYQLHFVLPGGAGWMEEAGSQDAHGSVLMSFSILYCVFPLELLAGYGWKHDRIFSVIIGNVLWFTAACSFNVFPGFLLLVFCVMGFTAVLVFKDFENVSGAGLQAVGASMALTGAVLVVSYYVLLPRLDVMYTETMVQRGNFYWMVNDKWIPGIQSVFSDIAGGFGSGVDVTGELHRSHPFSDRSSDAYRVWVDSLPEGSLYLKGFLGGVYEKDAWKAMNEGHLDRYYRENGLNPPENYAELVNIGYAAVSAQPGVDSGAGHIAIEELGGRGSYSVYPYGVLLTEDYQVHSDGSVARKGKNYEFDYLFLRGNGGSYSLSGDWQRLEQQYRQYVYDSFLEYPEERLPELTDALYRARIRTDSTLACASDLMHFLEKQAVYDLDVGRNPADTDFVEYFLFESHKGYCVHFASAGVLAFRYFGIPARYAAGYVVSPEDFTKDGNGYTAVLTGEQAHAWVEIYLDAVGWVPVEMTPGAVAFSADNRMEVLEGLESWQEDTLDSWEWNGPENSIPTAKPWEEDGTGSLSESEDEPSMQVPTNQPEEEEKTMSTPEGPKGTGEDEDKEAEEDRQVWRYWAAVSVSIAMVCGAAAVWLGLQRAGKRHWHNAMQKAGRNERSFLLYRNLRKALRIAGCSERAAMRGEEFWRKAQENCPALSGEEYEAFCTVMEKGTFGRTELSVQELQQVYGFHDKLVRGVYARAPFYRKVLFQVWRCHI